MELSLIMDNVSKHIELSEEEKEFFVSLLKPRQLKRKEILLRPGEFARHTNFIVKGCLQVYTIDAKGAMHITIFAMEDWWISDLASFLSEKPATHFIDAIEQTHLLQLEKNDLEKLYRQVPKFERYFRILHQNAFVAQMNRLEQNLSLEAEERYRLFRQRYPALEHRISQKKIASFLGITPEFLSMIRRKQAES
ncbi:Crp/Fnr family transcriptional regulator [Flammeovirgaceae bacterium 311]|nr:Crp/Fnr family transcriptional regulator [Flammeovirgaceae bacterium 311]